MKFHEVEEFRVKNGPWGSKKGDPFGLFFIRLKPGGSVFKTICAPADEEWQHVSVSLPNRTPHWSEMCRIKELFWGEDVTCIQFHPKKEDYVNFHPYCLHIWRWTKGEFPLPPTDLVGPKSE